MQYLVSAEEMKRYDKNTIDQFEMPSLLLMERAALFVAENIQERFPCNKRILIVAGTGNNGGDGIAAGRILWQRGYQVTFLIIGREELYSEQTKKQLDILKNYKIDVYQNVQKERYDIIVDALFGIGLSKPFVGIYEEVIQYINQENCVVIAVDIPSGVDADSGHVYSVAVKADLTVTFAFRKRGHYLYPGNTYTGELVCGDIGITKESFLNHPPKLITYDASDKNRIPLRDERGNKGTFGKVLLIAGNKQMSGACELAARSIFRIGAGMVKIFTVAENRELLQKNLPEAMLITFQSDETISCIQEKWQEAISWADCIAIGPGIGTSTWAVSVLEHVLTKSQLPTVIDADALNILAKQENLQLLLKKSAQQGRSFILTPHVMEFSRISGNSVEAIKEDMISLVHHYALTNGIVLVCKDAKTVIYDSHGNGYLNTTGNNGMATAGSGDVLTGIITGLLAQGMSSFEAAKLGVYLHAYAGDSIVSKNNPYALMASDLVEELKYIL